MKIFRDDGIAYIQKADLAFWVSQLNLPVPASIAVTLFNIGDGHAVWVDKRSRYDFAPVTDKDGIKILKEIEWIDDFDTVDQLSDDDIAKMGFELIAKANKRSHEFDNYHKSGRDEEAMETASKCKMLRHRVGLLEDYLMFRKGKLIWRLPEGIESVSAHKPSLIAMTIRQIFEFI